MLKALQQEQRAEQEQEAERAACSSKKQAEAAAAAAADLAKAEAARQQEADKPTAEEEAAAAAEAVRLQRLVELEAAAAASVEAGRAQEQERVVIERTLSSDTVYDDEVAEQGSGHEAERGIGDANWEEEEEQPARIGLGLAQVSAALLSAAVLEPSGSPSCVLTSAPVVWWTLRGGAGCSHGVDCCTEG